MTSPTTHPTGHHPGTGLVIRLLIGALLAAALLLGVAPHAAAALPDARLEAGPQTGYTIASTGEILSRKTITLTKPTSVHVDARRTYAILAAGYLHMTSGPLAGYLVAESPVAYLPGLAGDTRYRHPVKVTFPAGRYIGYSFTADWSLGPTTVRTMASVTTAMTDRRAVIDGRPYVVPSTGGFAGQWVPVTRPRGLTARGLTCAVPAKPPAGSSAVWRRISTDESKLALTFDMGGRLTPAVAIMERLVVDRVCATIFPTGEAAGTTTGRAVMALVKAHPELFEVGNHTVHHCNLRDGTDDPDCPAGPATAAFIGQELTDADATIASLTGRATAPYWRPPYGAYDTRVRDAAAAAGYTKTVMWSIDTIDWRPIADGGPRASDIAAKVVTNAETGSTVLMHLGGYHTYDALPSMVVRLRADGLQPTTLSDLVD